MPEPRLDRALKLSSQAKRGICYFLGRATILCLTALFLAFSSLNAQNRPPILGIAGVGIAAPSDLDGFYAKGLGLMPHRVTCAGLCIATFGVDSHQRIDLVDREPFDSRLRPTHNYLLQLTLETSDVEALRRYLQSREVHVDEFHSSGPDGSNPQFWVGDPEGHRIGFIQFTNMVQQLRSEHQVSTHLIHAGFVVHDRTAMEHFYRDILGFRPYWHGGMKDNQTDWLDLQVPDGTDWIEFMLNAPADADKKLLGVMNHIALGVPDIHAAAKQLLTNGMKLSEEPQIGRDGKWQLNLYDPDDTRVELMEFTPVEKPCCSSYTGPHPKP
jgi:catechol 2,3-dioxygenase-like lactoylglutathione lyase family enzyme